MEYPDRPLKIKIFDTVSEFGEVRLRDFLDRNGAKSNRINVIQILTAASSLGDWGSRHWVTVVYEDVHN